jgi:hypothetical protein
MYREMHDVIAIVPNAGVSVCEADLSTVKAILQSAVGQSTEVVTTECNDIVVSSIEQLTLLKGANASIQSLYVAVISPDRLLYESESKRLDKNEFARVAFRIDSGEIKFTVITVSVVFHGSFVGLNYVPGDISVQIKRVCGDEDYSSDRANVANIICDQNNSMHQLGVVMVQIGSPNTTIRDGLYEVIVTAKEAAFFSVSLRGSSAVSARAKLEAELAGIIQNEREARKSLHLSTELEPAILLLDRKFKIEQSLLRQAKHKCDESEIQIEELELRLDDRDELPDEGAFILKRMKILEEEYKHWRLVLDGR